MFRKMSFVILSSVICCSEVLAMDCGKILVVLSDQRILPVLKSRDADSTFIDHPTGYFLSEMVGPLLTLEKLGYTFEFATPSGRAAVVDPISLDPNFFGGAEGYAQALQYIAKLNEARGAGTFQNPHSLSDLQIKNYEALVVPGGHAAMVGLPQDPHFGKILLSFHEDGKPTALICHGPCALLAARYLGDGRPWPYQGYRMTVFSTQEEIIEEGAGPLGGYVSSYPEGDLKKYGGAVSVTSEPWKPLAIRDRELITGQNPASHEVFSAEIVEALMERRLNGELSRSFQRRGTLVGALEGRTYFPKWTGKFDAKASAYVLGLGENLDWTTGYSTIFVGKKKSEINHQQFLEKLSEHVNDVSGTFSKVGLKGYVVWTNGEVEVAYQNWESEAAANKAFEMDAAKKIVTDASKIMESVVFKRMSEPAWLNRILPAPQENIPDAH